MSQEDLIRILILDRFYFPDEQATSVYLTELAGRLSDRFQIEVLCGPPAVVTEENRSVRLAHRVYQIFCLKLPKRILFARLLNDLSFFLAAFLRGLFIRNPDLLVSQTSPPAVWWVGFLLSRLYGARWIHVSKDVFPENLKVLSGHRNGRWASFLDPISSFPLRNSDRIVVIGEDMRRKFLEKGFPSQQIVKVSDWVDLNFIRPFPKTNAFSKKYKLTGKFVVLYAGNLGRIQNFEDFLNVAERLRGQSEIIFVLVGEGALKKKLIREATSRKLNNILTAPFEPRSKLPEVLAAADVSVILLKKGMAGLSVPSKIYSILASGRPILACLEKESDIARMVWESNSGFVVPPGNPEEFAERILSLYKNPDLRREFGLNARRFAEEQDFQRVAFEDYERTFREVVDGKFEKNF